VREIQNEVAEKRLDGEITLVISGKTRQKTAGEHRYGEMG